MSKFKPYNDNQIYLLPPSVEEFLPKEHLAYLIDEIVESLDTNNIEDKYCEMGQKSYHPKIFLKLLFYGYCTGVRSGRKISCKCETDVAYMYLAKMYRPDFRTINDFRKDNIEEFERYFRDILHLCRGLGMGKAGRIIVDSTKMRANASTKRTKNLKQYEKWSERVDEQIKDILKEVEENERMEDELYGEDKRGDELPEELQKAVRSKVALRKKIEEAKEKIKKINESKNIDSEGKKSAMLNLTDEDAKKIKDSGKLSANYSSQTSVSEDRIILSARVSNNASDKAQLIDAIDLVEKNTGEKVREVLADAGYSSYDNYETLEKREIKGYIPDQEYNHYKKGNDKYDSGNKNYLFHRNKFIYDKEKNEYKCPDGRQMVFERIYIDERNKQKSKVYRSKSCEGCELKSLCTKGKFRKLHIELREDLRTQMRERLDSKEGKQIYDSRQYIIEPIFGHFKFNLKYQMYSMRGIKKVNAEYSLICLAHNIMKIKKNKDKNNPISLKNLLDNYKKIFLIIIFINYFYQLKFISSRSA